MFDMRPLPGDPGKVTADATRMVEAADKMRRAAETLRRLSDTSAYRSDAVDAMRQNAHDLGQVMAKAEVRYRDTGQALLDYAPKLDAAQQKAARAIAAASHTDLAGATATVARAKVESLNPLLSPEEQTQAAVDYHRAKVELGRQTTVAVTARTDYEAAQTERDQAALVAMSRIHSANQRSGLNDTFWDDFDGFKEKYLIPLLDAITVVLDVVAKITTVVAIIAAFVPGLQPLALALFAIGRAVTVISLVVLVIQFAIGAKTLGALVSGVLFLAASKLLKAGSAGKGTTGSAKPNDWITGMGVKDGVRYTGERFADGSPHWAAGATEAGKRLVVDPTKDYVKGEAEDWLTSQVDSMVDPGDVWTTDKAVTHDVTPVGSDFSGIDTSAIIATSFGTPSDAPVTACQTHVPSSGGGGGGW